MARPAKQTYTAKEVELIAHALLAGSLGGVTQAILQSGAKASPEIGAVVMHFSAGSVHHNGLLKQAQDELALDEGRAAHIQELINGFIA